MPFSHVATLFPFPIPFSATALHNGRHVIANPTEYTVLTLQKTLVAIRHVVIYGAESCVDEVWSMVPQVDVLREYNTVLDAACKRYVMREEREVTVNQWARVESDGSVELAGSMAETPVTEDTRCFAGRQDIRVFAHGDELLYTATVCTRADPKRLCIEYGKYDMEAHTLTGTVIASPQDAECEKNGKYVEAEIAKKGTQNGLEASQSLPRRIISVLHPERVDQPVQRRQHTRLPVSQRTHLAEKADV